MSIRLIVFDVAGTTVLDDDAVIDAMQTACATRRVPVDRRSIKAVMGMPKLQAIQKLLAGAPAVAPQTIDPLAAQVHAAFIEFLLRRYRRDSTVRPVPEAVNVFKQLREAGIRIALDTGFSREVLDVLLTRLEWTHGVVDVTVTSDEVEKGRPHPHLIRRAMQLTGIKEAHEVAKVGDTPADIEEGRAAGCGLVVGVTYGTHSRAELERFAVPLIDRLPDLLLLVGAA